MPSVGEQDSMARISDQSCQILSSIYTMFQLCHAKLRICVLIDTLLSNETWCESIISIVMTRSLSSGNVHTSEYP